MIAVTRREVLTLAGLAAAALLVGFALTSTAFGNPFHSVEVGVAEASPLGILGGKVIPASCPSYAHTLGECGPTTYQNGCAASYLSCVGEGSCTEQFYQIPCPACPSGQTGTYPDCRPITCADSGQVGTYPNCTKTTTETCPAGTTGTPPNCVSDAGTCPAGTNGTPPDCLPNTPGNCPAGYMLSPSGTCIPDDGTGGGNAGGGSGGSNQCVNLPGSYTFIPSGYTQSSGNVCTPSICSTDPSACDFCPNLPGLQSTAGAIPSGYVVNTAGNCVPFGGETCDLNAQDLIIGPGESTTLNYSCGASSSASGLNFSTGGKASGQATVSPSETTDYWLQCQAGCQDLVTVEVVDFSLDISGSPSRVRSGQPATITWNASGVQSCTVSGPDGFSASGTSGTKQTGPIEAASTYTLTCQTVLGPRSDSFRVNVLPDTSEF